MFPLSTSSCIPAALLAGSYATTRAFDSLRCTWLLQFVGLTHHQVEICVIVDRCTNTRVVVDEFFFGHLQPLQSDSYSGLQGYDCVVLKQILSFGELQCCPSIFRGVRFKSRSTLKTQRQHCSFSEISVSTSVSQTRRP